MRHEQQIGKAGEELAERALRNIGVEMVERIGTPVRTLPVRNMPGMFKVIYGEKVSGDFRGVLPGGLSVLAECKTILDRSLRWSDMREHQPGKLSEHAQHGGLSLLVWVHSSGVFVLRWPVDGFGPGHSLDPVRAEMAAIVEGIC